MEYPVSLSITKMNGFPIVPPLITNDITIEIQYYRQLAIAVEERLKILEKIRKDRQELNKNFTACEGQGDILTDFVLKSEDNNVQQDMNSSNEIIIDYSTKNKSEENLIDISTPTNEKIKSNTLIDIEINSKQKQENIQQLDKSMSDDDKSCLNETLICNSSSDTITISTDLNQYLNTSSASIKSDITDTISENWKPQVPQTLDIVPIMVDKLKSSDKSNLLDEETPRLMRRGSYVLDAPSPMLLASIQNESTNTENKIQKSSAQPSKCKELNTNEKKSSLENKTPFKEPTSFYLNSGSKFRKGYHTTNPSHRVSRSVSNSKTCSPLDVYQPAKSVECIQAMFIKELYSPKTANSRSINQSKVYSPVNGTNGVRNHGSKKMIKSTSILNLANRLSGSLGSLSSVNSKCFKRAEKKNNDTNLAKNVNPDGAKINDSKEEKFFFQKQKRPVITSEKIITIFKDIQDSHKKEVVELLSRQQKEQIIMQENFKKQQIILLAQIRKAFPEMSISALSEAISGKNAEHKSSPSNLRTGNEGSNSVTHKDVQKLKVNGINCYKKDEPTITKSNMEYTNQSKELSSTHDLSFQQTTPTTCSLYQSNCQSNQIFNDPYILNSHIQLPNIRAIDDIPVGNPNRRHSNVSRQLFPLDNKISRTPAFDNFVYTEKHIKAATIINAYAKGFLIRRLMKTEKMIALKNTYKEALHCMLRLHLDEPLQVPEVRFKQRLQQQCDAASMNIVYLVSQSPDKRMEIIAHDREIKTARSDRPSSAHSYSFATQRTLARKKQKETGIYRGLQSSMMSKSCPVRTRCQTWTSNSKEKKITNSFISQGIKRSTSAGAVRKPWR